MYNEQRIILEGNEKDMQRKVITYSMQMPLEVFDYGEYITVGGIKFHQFENLSGHMEIFSRKDYEFGGISNGVFIDVGMNIGDSTLYAAAQENIDKVYAYEPFALTYKIAAKNVSLNPELASKIELNNYGWSNINESMSVPVCDDINCSAVNTIKDTFAMQIQRERTQSEQIEVRKSSEVLREIINKHPDQPIILKMDIEGAEYDCFDDIVGADLLKNVSIIFMEWHLDGYKQITDVLEANNFIWFNENFSSFTGFIRAFRKPE